VLGKEVIREHGGIDVLVNNAGRSIRRSLELSQDRFHDFERTMQLNYFGSLKMIMAFLPSMREQQRGHIINVSTIGVQANTPRYSAYVASKAALDAFSRSAAAELVDQGISITTVYMPLVKTEMSRPTTFYDSFSSITPAQAADLICDAVVRRPKRVSTPLGIWGELSYASSPRSVDRVLNAAYRLFPDSAAARGEESENDADLSSLAAAFARVMRGVHW
jgi:NAD(P)-dependent dehydrogenase (short-subunit alcohol dehydrogenase family)